MDSADASLINELIVKIQHVSGTAWLSEYSKAKNYFEMITEFVTKWDARAKPRN